MPESGKLEHQYKLYLICSILNIIQHSLKFRSALYALSRLTFIGILIYDFHILKFCISLKFFSLGIQTVTIYLHGCGYPGIYIAFNLFIHFSSLPQNIPKQFPTIQLQLVNF